MMKTFITILLLVLCIGTGFSMDKKNAEPVDFPDIFNPFRIVMDDENLYVSQKASIFVYSLKDFKLKVTFGKEGNGPKEMKPVMNAGVFLFPQKDNRVVVNAMGKLLIFSKKGEFISETALRKLSQSVPMFQPMGDKYAGTGTGLEQKQSKVFITYNIYDRDFNVLKELGRKPLFNGTGLEFPVESPLVFVADDKIVMPGAGSSTIDVFQPDGKIFSSIKLESKPLKVTDQYKKGVLELFKKQLGTSFSGMRDRIKFKDAFPGWQSFLIDNGKIYILTYLREKGLSEFYIYSMSGKFQKREMLPLHYANAMGPSAWTIKDDVLYQMIEKEDEELYQLHSYKFE